MFKKIAKLFSTKDEDLEIEEKTVEPVEPEAPPEPKLPDIIEIPKEIAIIPVNLDLAVDKTYKDYKEFLFEIKMKEIKFFEVIEKFKEVKERKIQEIKEKYVGDLKDEYDFVYPKGTGKPGFLKKKNKPQQS
jgi:hypothetical protein